MSASGIVGILWVLTATATAMLPLRRQYASGVVLLILAPVVIGWLWAQHGWAAGAFALFAVLSMFRRPLTYLGRRVLKLPVEEPPR